MSERSLFWDDGLHHGGTVLDRAPALTSIRRRERTEEMELLAKTLGGVFGDAEGVLRGHLNELAVSVAGSALRTASGRAVVDGTVFENDANLDLTPATPTAGTTALRVVLHKGWASGTVEIELLEAADGVATPPAVTQTGGATWEISLATAEVTTGGVLQTLVDTRDFVSVAALYQLLIGSAERGELMQHARFSGTAVGGGANNEVVGNGVQIYRDAGTVTFDATNRKGVNLNTGTTPGATGYASVGTDAAFDVNDGEHWFICRAIFTAQTDHVQAAGFLETVNGPVSAANDDFNAFVVWNSQFGDSKLYAACGTGSTHTKIDTGVTIDGATEHLLMIRVRHTGDVHFWVDGSLVDKIETNVAAASMHALVSSRLDSGATSRTLTTRDIHAWKA